MRTQKKKKHPLLAMAIGALTLYGAYSAVCSVKCCLGEKIRKMTCIFKKNKSDSKGMNSACQCEE